MKICIDNASLFSKVSLAPQMKTKQKAKDKVNVVTLGCSKNLVDSENIITQLHGNDIKAEHESTEEDANVIIVNTCGFIENAKEESVNTISTMQN